MRFKCILSLYVKSIPGTYEPRQANLVLIAYASSEDSGETAHLQAVSQEEPSDRKPDLWPL